MKSTSKRMWMRAGFAVFALSASTLMVSCGKKEEPKEVAKEAPKAEAPKPEPLKVGFIYVGPVGDAGWTFAHDMARKAIEEKFKIDLTGRPTMYTVRGFLRKNDGSIHTDSETKIITVLLYLNDNWSVDGGRLRILRSGTDLEDYVAEVPPSNGTLLVFRRSDNSWHGHKPFEGQRRVVQMNWVLDEDVVNREQRRHSVSTRFKKLKNFFTGRAA